MGLGKCLLLNASYEPLCLCSVERAVVLLYQGKVDLVEQHEDKVLRSANGRHPWPTIVRVVQFKHVERKKIPLTKRNIFRRDGFECSYCGRPGGELTVDHIQPKSRGGRDDWSNLTSACKTCNNVKNDRTPEEAGMVLRKKPSRPNHIVFFKAMAKEIDPQWEKFLFN